MYLYTYTEDVYLVNTFCVPKLCSTLAWWWRCLLSKHLLCTFT